MGVYKNDRLRLDFMKKKGASNQVENTIYRSKWYVPLCGIRCQV